jgi:uncharacterized integral membrane protein
MVLVEQLVELEVSSTQNVKQVNQLYSFHHYSMPVNVVAAVVMGLQMMVLTVLMN